jgi:hypothetical protein
MTAKRTAGSSEIAVLRAEVASQGDEIAILRAQLNALLDIAVSSGAQPAPIADGVSLMSPKQAAHVTGLSRSAMQNLITSGKVAAMRHRGRWYLDPSTLPGRVDLRCNVENEP